MIVPVRLDPLPGGPKLTFLPRRSSIERMSVLRQDVHLGNRQTEDVVNPVLQVGRFALGAEIFEHVRLRDGEIHTAQIKQILQVGGGAIGHDRQDAEVVPVVEHFGHLVGKAHIGAVDEAAGNAHRPGVLALPHHAVAAGVLDNLRQRLRFHGIDLQK